jgi:hypothetical protein
MTLRRRGYFQESKFHPGTKLPLDVDISKWSPATDKKGRPIKPGDYVSSRKYPKGTVRGVLEISKRAWAVERDGSKVASLVLVDDDGTRYNVSSVLKIEKRKR